jgi:tetratricopeptide (TPR) repeat protein
LNLDHDFTLSTGLLTPVTTTLSILLLFFLVFIAIKSAGKKRLLSFCILWFLGNHIIESSVINLEIIFEHRNYLPSMMFILLITILTYPMLKHPAMKSILFGAIIIMLASWTFERNLVWHDKITLWSDCVSKSPQKARPHNNLGVALKDKGRITEAIAHFKKTIAIDPGFTEAYINLGNSYILLGKYKEAIRQYQTALPITDKKAVVHIYLGNALTKIWQLQEALLHYGEAMRLKPGNKEAQMNYFSTLRLLNSKRSGQ